MVGRTILYYQVLEKLGEGGVGASRTSFRAGGDGGLCWERTRLWAASLLCPYSSGLPLIQVDLRAL